MGRVDTHYISLQVSPSSFPFSLFLPPLTPAFPPPLPPPPPNHIVPPQLLKALDFFHSKHVTYHAINSDNVMVWNLNPLVVKLSHCGVTHSCADCDVSGLVAMVSCAEGDVLCVCVFVCSFVFILNPCLWTIRCGSLTE